MKILVVEDDRAVAQTLQILLSSFNYAVDIAADGDAGLQMTDAFDYDLILLDVILPKLDGISLCQQLRAKGFQSPILLLTGQSGGRQKAIALNAGADDYVVKPFDAEELMARVQALLRRGNSTSQPILTWGNLSLDPDHRRVSYGIDLLSVTPKEYAILELFLRNPQKALSARVILDHVWTSLESPGEETVRGHIKELRQKLTAIGAPKDLIKTKHRVGYQLNPLYSSFPVPKTADQLTVPQIAELKAVNEELRTALEELQVAEEELRQQNEELLLARQKIAQEQRHYQDLFEFAPDGYLVTDIHGNIQEANRAAIAMLGCQRLIGKPLVVFVAKSERVAFLTQLATLMRVQDGEVTLQPRSGDPFPVLIKLTQIEDAQSQIIQLRWALRDIREQQAALRERKQMEQQLQAAHDELEQRVAERTAELHEAHQQTIAVWESMTDAYTLLDPEWRVVYANATSMQAMCQLSNLEPEAILGKSHWELFPSTVGQPIEREYRRAMAQQVPIHLEMFYEPTGGWFEIDGYPSAVGLSLYYRDISDRKRREANLTFLAEIAEDFSRLSSAEEIIQAVGVKIGTYLNVTTCNFCEVDEVQDEVIYLGRWNVDSVERLPDRICLSEQVSEDFCRRVRVGETIVSHNTQTNSVTNAQANAAIGALSFITVPFHKNGEWKYLFSINDQVPRTWREDEIELVRELANRLFPRLERAHAEAALRQSEEKYRLLFNFIDEGFILCDVIFDQSDRPIDIFYVDANAAAVRMTGQELVGRRTSDLSPNFEPEWFEIFGRVACTGEAVRMELPAAPLNTWYEFYCFRPDETNNTRVAAIYKDISEQQAALRERKQAELTLQRQIRQEHLLADIAQDIRRSLNLNDVLSRTVQRVREFLDTDRVMIFQFYPDWQGEAIMESVGEGWIPIVSTNIYDPCFSDRYIEPYRQGRIATLTDIDTEDLEPCYVELLKSFQVKANLVVPILQGENLWGLLIAHHCSAPRQWQPSEIDLLRQLATTVGIAIKQAELYQQLQTELAERKLAEQTIREQAALLNITSDAIFVRDLDHRILYWNQGAERLYGWHMAEAMGQLAHELLQNNPAQVAEIMQILLDRGQWQGEIGKVTKTGKKVIVEARWTLARDEAGQPKFILSVDTDITEKKQLEAQFYRAQRLESLGTLASGIAHDLNNDLTPILAISQLLRLQQPHLDKRSQEMLKILENSAKHGANMVKQILTFTRGTGGERSPVQVASVLQETINVVQRTFPKAIVIRQNIPTQSPWLVSADSTYLHQVFMNLCVNARDAMPNGGTLSLTVEHCFVDQAFAQINLDAQIGNYVVVTIADTGTGIPPEVRDRIFDPFFTTKEPGQGTGLGLATVLGIVKDYGGFLQVFSEVEQGTQLKVYLPIIKAIPTRSRPPEEQFNGNRELILIVDDDVAVQKSTQALLEIHDYTVLSTNDGLEAIALYAQNQNEIRLVILDIMMPNMNGISLIQRLKAINPMVKIIAMSGLSANRKSALDAGANAFLSKPYTLENLLENIQNLITA